MERKLSQDANQYADNNSGESFYKKQFEIATRDKAQLQERLHELETRNALQLKSLFELSTAPLGSNSVNSLPIDIVQALKKLPSTTEHTPPSSGKGSAYRRQSLSERTALFPQAKTGLSSNISPDYVPFRKRADLVGHTAAIYAVQFSANGQRLVSVSFDKSVCVWPVDRFLEKTTYEPSVTIPEAHRAPVVAVEWTFDSARVVSGALDQTVAEWDVDSGRYDPIGRYNCHGLVNAVSVSPANDNLFFVATSKNSVHLIDRRAPPPLNGTGSEAATIVNNETAVNTIHVTVDGYRFITGDHGGAISAWDLRMVDSRDQHGVGERKAALIGSIFNDDNHRPITHIHTSPPTTDEDFGRHMVVNSYDTYLRVYERSSFLFNRDKPELHSLHALRGVHNLHWPIKSSFFVGSDYRPERFVPRQSSRRRRNWDIHGKSSQRASRASSSDQHSTNNSQHLGSDDEDQRYSNPGTSEDEDEEEEEQQKQPLTSVLHSSSTLGGGIQNSMVLASGSADGNIYVFDVGGRTGTGRLIQKLEGHKGIVYAVDFHPYEPILASCSADSSISIWHSAP